MIPQETVERILDTVRIEDIIGDFVSLKRRGANFMACCPFHNEKTPSFSVSPSKGIFKCFGCGKSGSAVGFLMEHEGLSYIDALKYIAKKYGIEVIEEIDDPEALIARQRRESLMLVSEFAAKFFQDQLEQKEGRAVGYAYFKSRGLEDKTIKNFGLGWAPSGKKELIKAARESGYKEDYLLETGLCTKYEDGNIADRFYDRAMFPIHSVSGRVIAFGGRTLRTDKSVAKYVNSKESEIYVKNQSLYGIWFAKSAIVKQNQCILVEGYLDVITMHQLGITNVVASSGTSLTENQVRLIRKFTENVTIIYDGDSAGIHAALRGIGLVLEGGLNVRIVLLPDGEDPDSYSRKHTKEEVEEFISENSQDFITFKTDMLLGEAKGDPIKRANVINEIADTIALIPDAVVRAVYVKRCAAKFEIDEQILADRVSRSRADRVIANQKEKERSRKREDITNDIPASHKHISDVEAYLAPCEKELLRFILEEGCTELDFDRDSKFYTEGEKINVAEFIDGILADDEADFFNDSYRKVYQEYFRMYDEGLTQQQIQKRLLDSMDKEIAAVACDLLIDRYQLTVKVYEDSLTANSTRLVMYVPKTLLTYQVKKVELFLKELTAELAGEDDLNRQEEIMKKIGEYNKTRASLNNELGRV